MTVFVMNHTASLANNNAEVLCAKCGKLTSPKVLLPSLKRGYEERLFECPARSYMETVFIKL
jgi:hypothetical protein